MRLSELLDDTDRIRNRLTVPILMSSDHAEACRRARDDMDRARRALQDAEQAEQGLMSRPAVERATAELDTAELERAAADEAAAPHVVDFVVESVGSDDWEQLVGAHPPTDEQKRQYGDDTWFNPSTFPIVAVAACLAEPAVDGVEDVRRLKSRVPDIVWQQLFAAAIRVNRGVNAVPKSLIGSARTKGSDVG